MATFHPVGTEGERMATERARVACENECELLRHRASRVAGKLREEQEKTVKRWNLLDNTVTAGVFGVLALGTLAASACLSARLTHAKVPHALCYAAVLSGTCAFVADAVRVSENYGLHLQNTRLLHSDWRAFTTQACLLKYGCTQDPDLQAVLEKVKELSEHKSDLIRQTPATRFVSLADDI